MKKPQSARISGVEKISISKESEVILSTLTIKDSSVYSPYSLRILRTPKDAASAADEASTIVSVSEH
mgnify:CR=1 FL=1